MKVDKTLARKHEWAPWIACMVLHAVLAAAQAFVHSRRYFREPYALNALYLAFGQMALFIPHYQKVPPLRVDGRIPVFGLAVVVFGGAFLRLADFTTYPGPFANVVEETQTGRIALRSMSERLLDPDFPLTDFLAELSLVFGGTSMNALRVPFVILSICGIYFFFLAARQFFRSREIVIAVTILYAANAYLAASGRIAMETFAPVATVGAAMAACFFARNRFTPFSWGLAGISVGLLWQEYFSYRMVALALVGLMICALAQGPPIDFLVADRRPWRFEHLRRFRMLLVVFLGMAGATVSPVVVANLQRPQPGGLIEGLNRYLPNLSQRLGEVGLGTVAAEAGVKLWQTIRFIFSSPIDDVLWHETGFFELLGGTLALLSVGWCLATSWRRPGRSLLVAVPLAAVLLSSVFAPEPMRYRTLCIVPFMILAIGVLTEDLWLRFRSSWLGVALALTLVVLVERDVTRLFREGINNASVKTKMIDPIVQMVVEMRKLQKSYPEEPTYGVFDAEILTKTNDYEFLYIVDRVKMLRRLEEVPPNANVVVLTSKAGVGLVDYSRLDRLTVVQSAGGRYEIAVGRTENCSTSPR